MQVCHRCGELELGAESGFCEICGRNTALWVGVDAKPFLQRLRLLIFRRMSVNPRYALEATEESFPLPVFEAIVAVTASSQQVQTTYDSDPDEEHSERCKSRTVRYNSWEDVATFASFHELRQAGGPLAGAAQAAKIFPESGEVAVLVPPLQLKWLLTSNETERVKVQFSWAMVNAQGSVRLPCLCRCSVHTLKLAFESIAVLISILLDAGAVWN